MTELIWQAIEPKPVERMIGARRQAHNALHWLARLANTYIEADDENRHVELVWDNRSTSLHTKSFGPGVTVEVRLPALEMQFCENGKPAPHVLALDERTPAHVEAWVLVELLHRGIDRDRFSKALPYPAKDLMLGDHEEHEAEAFHDELNALNGWVLNAVTALVELRHEIARESGVDASKIPIVCWPQTFQLGIETSISPASDGDTLRIGLSAGDALRPQPYFFVGTSEQALKGDFDPASVLSVQRIASENLAADDVIAFLRAQVGSHRKRIAS